MVAGIHHASLADISLKLGILIPNFSDVSLNVSYKYNCCAEKFLRAASSAALDVFKLYFVLGVVVDALGFVDETSGG